MRAALSRLRVVREPNLAMTARALEESAEGPRPLVPMAGGTDLFVYLNAGALPEQDYLDLWHLDELRGVIDTPGGVRIHALETFANLRRDPLVKRRYPALAEASSWVGARQIQNRATIAGNIANGSPAGDSLPVLLALDARIRLVRFSAPRDVGFDTFYTGYRTSVRHPSELIHSILLPWPLPGTRQYFRKVGTRLAQAISKVVIATTITVQKGRVTRARIALGSVAATVVRVPSAEDALLGEKLTPAAASEAARRLRESIHPIDDIRSTAAHRLRVAGRLVELAVADALR